MNFIVSRDSKVAVGLLQGYNFGMYVGAAHVLNERAFFFFFSLALEILTILDDKWLGDDSWLDAGTVAFRIT